MRLATPMLAMITALWLSALAWEYVGAGNFLVVGLAVAFLIAPSHSFRLRVLREAVVWEPTWSLLLASVWGGCGGNGTSGTDTRSRHGVTDLPA
jgi:hypothetical protein